MFVKFLLFMTQVFMEIFFIVYDKSVHKNFIYVWSKNFYCS